MTPLASSLKTDLAHPDFLGDLVSLFRRHRVPCGTPEDLNKLAPALRENSALRSDLFTLSTAISHMSPVDLTPEQLLELVARAVGTPSFGRNFPPAIPDAVASAFLAEYEAWSTRTPDFASDLTTVLPWPSVELAPVEAAAAADVPQDHPSPRIHELPQPSAIYSRITARPTAPPQALDLRFSAYPNAADSQVRRLRRTILLLTVLLIAASASTATFAWLYLHSPSQNLAYPAGTSPIPPAAPETPEALPAAHAPAGKDAARPFRSPQQPPTIHSAPIVRQPPSAPSPVAVVLPSSTLMSYAISARQPVFPRTTRDTATGTIDLEATISPSGRITAIRVLRGDQDMGPAAIHAMRTWRFKPYLVNGVPAEVVSGFTFRRTGQ